MKIWSYNVNYIIIDINVAFRDWFSILRVLFYSLLFEGHSTLSNKSIQNVCWVFLKFQTKSSNVDQFKAKLKIKSPHCEQFERLQIIEILYGSLIRFPVELFYLACKFYKSSSFILVGLVGKFDNVITILNN